MNKNWSVLRNQLILQFRHSALIFKLCTFSECTGVRCMLNFGERVCEKLFLKLVIQWLFRRPPNTKWAYWNSMMSVSVNGMQQSVFVVGNGEEGQGRGRGSAPCLVHIVAVAAVLSLRKHVWSTLTAVGAVLPVFLPALNPKGIKSCLPASVCYSQSALRDPTCGAFLCGCATWFKANGETACGFCCLPANFGCLVRNHSLFLYKIPQPLLRAPPLKTLKHD